MEENGKLVQFLFCSREVVAEKTEETSKRYLRGSTLLACAADYAATYYHYASDERGSVTHLLEGNEVKNQYCYDAWGALLENEEQVENRFQYAGEQYDGITGQYYLRARYYNPVLSRFTQEDPYLGDGLNLYAYCRNNPVKYVDPTGYGRTPGETAGDNQDFVRSKTGFDSEINANNTSIDIERDVETVIVYRGTSQYSEDLVYQETGQFMSDLARKIYLETGDIDLAYSTARDTHNKWIKIWGDENTYVQAHGEFGSEMASSFGLERTMLSVTTDKNVAEYFAGTSGVVYELKVLKSQLIPQTIQGAGESEYLIRYGTGGN